MKKFSKRTFLCGAILISSTVCFSQSSEKLLPNIMSPDVASLGKYGVYGVSYYTGAPNISIPLHEINENGLSIPLVLSYDASGFVPNKNAGLVGLNWNLTLGGAITRTVNGRADDSYDPNPVVNPDPFGFDKGYIYGQLQNGQPHYTSEEVRKIDFLVEPDGTGKYRNELGYIPKYYLKYEYEPDVFTFNFLGHSGKFFLDNNGVVQVSSDRRYKVDLTQVLPIYDFKTQLGIYSNSTTPQLLNNNLISKITITSDDGYEFTFGGAFKDIEVQFDYTSPIERSANSKRGVINAWYLTKVKTPEGVEILFKNYEYTNEDAELIKKLFESSAGIWDTWDASYLEVKIFRSQTRSYTLNSGGERTNNSGDSYSKALIKHCYLKQIITELQTVTINYQEKDKVNRFYNGSIFQPPPIGGNVNLNLKYYTQRINNISIFDNFNGGGLPVSYQPYANQKNITFSYVNKPAVSGTGNRLFLTGVNVNNAPYSFVYTNSDNLPDPITKGVDIWGFYNGKDNNSELVGNPQSTYGNPNEYEVDLQSSGNDRMAYANVALSGILQSITYPTGGKTEFTFENHDYSMVLKRKVTSGITPVWENTTGIAGGLRIKEIKNIPGTTTTFKYISNYEQNPNGLSSGLLIRNDIYKKDFMGTPGVIEKIVSDNNIAAAATYSEPHIGYKEVVEINSDGFTKYQFTNHQTNPDTYYLGNDAYKNTTERSSTNYNNQLFRLMKHSSRENERGKLMKKSVYNSSNALVQSTEYTYNTDPQRDLARTIGVYCPHSLRTSNSLFEPTWMVALVHSYALYYYQNLPTMIVEKNYSSNAINPLTVTTTLTYKSNINPLLTQKTVTLSDGSVMKYQYEYVEDFPAQAPYSTMITKNILTPVVRETISKDNTVLTINKHNYAQFSTNVFRIANEKTVNQQVLPNTDLDILTVTGYTEKGMLTEMQKANNHYTAYIWDYKGLYPIAKATNATAFDFAYTSFEADGYGGWQFWPSQIKKNLNSPTGKKYYTLAPGYDLIHGDISLAAHIVSYWSTGGQYSVDGSQAVRQGATINGWTYYEHDISGIMSAHISGTGSIDEVRVYLKGSQVTTYTYEPLSGLTSMCDPNNRITYYEYDERGRLVVIRDQNRNVLKKVCYNFWGQMENCTLITDATMVQTGQTRCKPCQANPAYTTNIFQHEWVDINPQSPTYNQTSWVDDLAVTTCVVVPGWQNTTTPLRCQQGSCGNTGYQEQEQMDMNPCSSTYGATQWILAGYNPTACAQGSNVTITYQNETTSTGFVALYTNNATGQTYSFNVPASGNGTLGCVPAGIYSLSISKPGNMMLALFGTGCFTQSGTSAFFGKVNVSMCNTVIIGYDL